MWRSVMENHVKTYIKAVKVYCKPLQGEKYQTLERKLKAVAEEVGFDVFNLMNDMFYFQEVFIINFF